MSRAAPSSRGAAALLAALLATSAVPAASAQARHVDGIVAIVGGHSPSSQTDVVLRSDVELRAWLALAAEAPDLPGVQVPEELLHATLDQIIGELVIAREAERLHAAQPNEEQIRRQRDELVRSLGGEERLRALIERLSIDPGEIDAIAERRAFVDAFLRANLEGSTLVSDAEVEERHERGDHPFAGRPLDEVRELLRAWLASQALERDVRRWIQVLRSRTAIRIVVPFAPPPSAQETAEDEEVRSDVGSGG